MITSNLHLDHMPVGEIGLGQRVLSWLEFVGATLAISRAWSAHSPVDAKTLARAGVTAEIQDRVLQLRY